MTFADLVAGESVFIDANTLIYHFGPHPTFGAACNQLIGVLRTKSSADTRPRTYSARSPTS